MKMESLSELVQRKMRVAEALNKGECGGSYVEACIITGALLSGIAADLWPGDKVDRVRFAELWARFAVVVPNACHISVPLLVDDLRRRSRPEDAEVIEDAESEGDTTDAALSRLCSTLTTADLRKFSYPNLFYRDVRCGLVHQYEMGSAATALQMSETATDVSYVEKLSPDGEVTHQIHFHMGWLTKLVLAIAERVESSVAGTRLKDPPVWWLDEGLEQPPDRRRRRKKRP